MDKLNKVLLCGYARVPSDTSAANRSDLLALILVVNRKTNIICDADVTFSTSIGQYFIAELLAGEDLTNIEAIKHLITSCYFGKLKRALLNALSSCYTTYQEQVLKLSDSK